MSATLSFRRRFLLGLVPLCLSVRLLGQNAPAETYPVDLPTVLRLANAQNLDVQVAREKLKEAQAMQENARFQFFPVLSPGFTFRRHDDLIQAVDGKMQEVHKQSYAPGVGLGGQWELGEAIYRSLAAKQQVKSATHRLESQRQESVAAALRNFFDLQAAHAAIGIAADTLRLSTNYEAQLDQAVAAGVAFQGDALRVRMQTGRSRLALQQAEAQEKIAAARLAQSLHLHPSVTLVPPEGDCLPLVLVETNATLASLLPGALRTRPELLEGKAVSAAAQEERKGAVYGPLIPSVGAQVFAGGLGGDSDAGPSRFGRQEDYFVGLSWKLGPGGLFDPTRRKAAEARLQTARLTEEKSREEVARQVVEAFVRLQSLRDQLELSRQMLAVAEKGQHLAQQRQEFAVGVVLENLQTQQDLMRARLDCLQAIVEFNKAQYALKKALGNL